MAGQLPVSNAVQKLNDFRRRQRQQLIPQLGYPGSIQVQPERRRQPRDPLGIWTPKQPTAYIV